MEPRRWVIPRGCMDKQIENNEEQQVEDSSQEIVAEDKPLEIEFMGQTFEATPEGIARYNAARQVFERTLGQQSQELGTLRKELPHIKRFGSSVENPDRAQLFKRVNDMLEEGDTEKSVKLMADYIVQMEESRVKEQVESNFKRQFEQAEPEIFEVLDKDLAWDYVFANYRDELYHQDDPATFVRSILEPKATKLKSKFAPAQSLKKESDEFEPLGKTAAAPKKQPPVKKEEAAPKAKTLRDLSDV